MHLPKYFEKFAYLFLFRILFHSFLLQTCELYNLNIERCLKNGNCRIKHLQIDFEILVWFWF